MPAKGWRKADAKKKKAPATKKPTAKRKTQKIVTKPDMYAGKTMEERRDERQQQAVAEGMPTENYHAEVKDGELDEMERRTINSISAVKHPPYALSVEDFENDIKDYLAFLYSEYHRLENSGKRRVRYPSVNSLCFWMGISKQVFYEYAKRPEYTGVINQFQNACEQETLDGLKNGKMNTIGGIFTGKIEHNMVEPTAPQHVTNNFMVSQDDIAAALQKVRENKQIASENENSENIRAINTDYTEIE
jgi:hypothetical protein